MPEMARPEGRDPNPAPDALRVEWSQTRAQRVVRLSGPVDQRTARHLDNALVGLGGRNLLIDLTDVEPSPEVEITRLLAGLKTRLGHRALILRGIDGWVGLPPSPDPGFGKRVPG